MSQEPVEEYPNTVMTREPSSSGHSNGSFGPVFAVLAMIIVVSAVACVVGRLCSRRSHGGKEAKHHQPTGKSKGSKQSQGLGPKEWESRQKPSYNMRDGDIEFGFDKKMGSSKGGMNGGGKGKPPHHNGGGHNKPDIRFSDNV